jgi:hypothetical protein
MRDLGLAEATVDNPMRHLRIIIIIILGDLVG